MCHKCRYLNSRSCLRIYIMLTTICSLCLHLTPLSISDSRPCSHSNIQFSASVHCSQSSKGWRRCGCDLTAPRKSPTSSVLHVVLRDGHITLRSDPVHSQTWSPLSDYLGQRHTSHFGRDFSIESLQRIKWNTISWCMVTGEQLRAFVCPISYKMNYIKKYVKLWHHGVLCIMSGR